MDKRWTCILKKISAHYRTGARSYVLIMSIFFFFLTFGNLQDRVATFINPRPVTAHSVDDIIGLHDLLVRSIDDPQRRFILDAAVEFTLTFRPERINESLFGDDAGKCKKTLTISGSQVAKRNPQTDWLADYFGLPTDFQSMVHFCPYTATFIFRPYFHYSTGAHLKHLYVLVSAPVVHTKWTLNIGEHVTAAGENGYSAGYFTEQAVPRTQLLSNFLSFVTGTVPSIENLTFHPLARAKMSTKPLYKTALAALQATLGVVPWKSDWYHVAPYIQGSLPTDNRPAGHFLFEPITNNGHQATVGIGCSGRVLAWHDDDAIQSVTIWANIVASHVFKAQQTRTFDIKGRPLSRYQLVEHLAPNDQSILAIQGAPNNPIQPVYAQEISPLANFTTFSVHVSAPGMVDFTLMAMYKSPRTFFTFFYGVWARTGEHIDIQNPSLFPANWAFKGDASVFGFVGENGPPGSPPIGTPVALSATESMASIYHGTNFPRTGIGTTNTEAVIAQAQRNPHIDFPLPAATTSGQRLVASTTDLSAENTINTSKPPVPLSLSDIDLVSGQTRGLAQKIGTHLHKTWTRKKYAWFLGFGAQVDFGRQPGPTEKEERATSLNTAFSFWSLSIKGGIFL